MKSDKLKNSSKKKNDPDARSTTVIINDKLPPLHIVDYSTNDYEYRNNDNLIL